MLLQILLAVSLMQSTGVAGAFISPPAEATQLGYDAIEHRGRRRPVAIESRSEDEILNSSQRQQLTSGNRDVRRNFALAAWMVRKHLDFVSRFRFQSNTKDSGFNREYEAAVRDWSARGAFEVSNRFRREKAVRMIEAHRTVDGDHAVLKLNAGRVQLIEGDRIRNRSGLTVGDRWVHGVKLDPVDAAIAYAVHKRRKGGGFEFDREVAADRLWLHGYFDRVDQVRGISPLAAGLANLLHTQENFEYALARAKIDQLLAYIFHTTGGDDGTTGYGHHTADTSQGAADAHPDGPKYSVDFGRGIVKLELDDGDDLKTLQTSNPSNQFQTFHQAVLDICLKALDLPTSFADESRSNFHSSLRAAQLYMRSARDKIEDNQELQTNWLRWRTRVAIRDEGFTLPRGETVNSLATMFVPDGVPWWDKVKEITGERLACSSGFDNPQRIAHEHGTDFYANVDRIAEAVEYARSKGLDLSFATDGITIVDPDALQQIIDNAG